MSRPLTRFGLSVPFVFAAMVLAFVIGSYLGGNFLVPPGQGLAAPAEAMGYGLLLALLALAVAIIAAMKMPMKVLGISALVGAIICVLFIGGLIFLIMKSNADRDAYIRDVQTRQMTAPTTEPLCPSPVDDATTDEASPCQDE